MLRNTAVHLAIGFQTALLGICLSSVATAAPIQAQASATIDHLMWHLVDLTPNDGIAPSVQFFPDYDRYSGIAMVNGAVQYGFSSDNNPIPWPSQADQIGNAADALAAISPSSLKTSAVIEGGLPASWTSIPGRDSFYSQSGYISAQGTFANGISIKLGPNTGIVLEGQAEVQVALDLAKVVGSSYFTDRPYAEVTLNSEASIISNLHRIGGDIAGITGSEWGMDAKVTDSVNSYQLNTFVSDPKSLTKTGNFQLTFSNATGADTQGVLKVAIFSGIAASGVPEPSTWLMWGLGLLALAWVARRKPC